jgi:hypothetical protein
MAEAVTERKWPCCGGCFWWSNRTGWCEVVKEVRHASSRCPSWLDPESDYGKHVAQLLADKRGTPEGR